MGPTTNLARRRARGAGLVETMIGVLIGLIVVLVIYNMLAVSESYKRMAVGSSDAQITGMLTQFVIGREVSNSGNGISLSGADLFNCDPAKANAAWPYNRLNAATPALWRPIPAMVRDSGNNDISDSFITNYSGSPHVVWPVSFTSDAAPSAPFIVQSPNGFTAPAPAATPYLVVAINPATGDCEDTVVTAATAPDAFGRVTLTHGATTATYQATIDPAAKLVNLGPVGISTRQLFENWDPTAVGPCGTAVAARGGCQIYTTDLFTAGASRVPIAQNIVLMKVQYGIDTSTPLNGSVDCWTPAIANITTEPTCNAAGVPGDWTPAAVRTTALLNLQRIVALRVGIVVRSDEPVAREEIDPASSRYNPTLVFTDKRPPVYLFNCAANNATCVNRITLSNNVIQDGWRYRTFETVIPLRNQIFNNQ
jgi:type IV pilus assembly protein PilW